MANNEQAAKAEIKPLTLELSMATTVTIERIMAKARKQGNDKGNYSVEYFVIDRLSQSLKTFNDYLDADDKRRREAAFAKERDALAVPDPGKPETMIAYAQSLIALQRKHGIGGTKQAV